MVEQRVAVIFWSPQDAAESARVDEMQIDIRLKMKYRMRVFFHRF